MTYVLPEKLKDLNPYDPVTEDFRIHLDANESFCEVPENIRQEILNAVSNVAFNRYPDPYARKLCEKAGAYYHVDPKLLTAGNGSDELISLVVPYFLDEGDTMLVAVLVLRTVSQNQSRIPSKRKQHEDFCRRNFTACEREKCKTADFFQSV